MVSRFSQYKVGCVFSMVIRSEFHMEQYMYRDDYHHEDVSHFIMSEFEFPVLKISDYFLWRKFFETIKDVRFSNYITPVSSQVFILTPRNSCCDWWPRKINSDWLAPKWKPFIENNDITKEEAVELTIYLCKYDVTTT